MTNKFHSLIIVIYIVPLIVLSLGAIPSANAQPLNKQPTICNLQGLDCYGMGMAAGAVHPGSTHCPSITANQTQEFCAGYEYGAANPPHYNSKGEIVCDNENNTGCHWDITTMGGFPCVHGPPYIPDRNGKCPLPMFMRSPASQ